MTNGALSLMGNLGPKAAVPGLMSDVQFLPFPYSYRCPFGLEHEQSVDINLNYIKHLLNDPESGVLKPAAIIVEAVQGEGGVIPAPVSWLKGLRELTNQHDIPLIIDEVQTGIGRTGKMFAFEHAGISPDMVVLSKAIGGGLPMSVLLYNKKWDKWQAGAHAGTFRGNQMAMAAGSITLDTIRQQGLVDNATKMGERLTNRLYELKDKHAFIGDVRGLGLMIGVEIIDPESASSIGGQFSTNPSLTSKLQQACLSQGLIIELGGRDSSVIRFLPPLIINAAEVDLVAAKFTQAIDMIISRDQIKLATA